MKMASCIVNPSCVPSMIQFFIYYIYCQRPSLASRLVALRGSQIQVFQSLSTGFFDVCFNQPPVDRKRRPMAKEHADLKRSKHSVQRDILRGSLDNIPAS